MGSVIGCGVRAPLTQFKGSSVTQVTPEAVSLNATFDISNTNDKPLKLKYYEYAVMSNGRTVYRGRASAEQTVPRWATVQNTIPIVIRTEYLKANQPVTWNLSGRLSYIPPTALAETLLKTGFWEPKTSIRASDDVAIFAEFIPTN
tara:strand:+ start:193 stop:630 length:438 start_codon:yes stop_codon:yes gene_type:complete